MQLPAAKHAGELAAAITDRNAQVAAVNTAIAENWHITSCRARNPQTGDVIELVLDTLDPATSLQSLQFILSIYQAQLTDLNNQLATVETWTPPAP